MASQPKVKIPHAVVAGVVVPHRCKYFINMEDVLLDRSLLDRLPLRGHKDGTDAIGENLKESNGVLNVFEVGGQFAASCRSAAIRTRWWPLS